jgi:hypothetical protein
MADILKHAQVARFTRAVADENAREITFVASDESVDSYGDIVRANGWQLDRFRANPVLLFAHNNHEPPIGHVPHIGVEGTELIARVRFLPKGVYERADVVWSAIEEGALRASSVGFIPTKVPNEIKDPATNAWTGGYEFIGQELMELSVVPVPANPNALAVARALGMTPAEWSRLSHEDRGQSIARQKLPAHEIAQLQLRRMRFAIRTSPR